MHQTALEDIRTGENQEGARLAGSMGEGGRPLRQAATKLPANPTDAVPVGPPRTVSPGKVYPLRGASLREIGATWPHDEFARGFEPALHRVTQLRQAGDTSELAVQTVPSIRANVHPQELLQVMS